MEQQGKTWCVVLGHWSKPLLYSVSEFKKIKHSVIFHWSSPKFQIYKGNLPLYFNWMLGISKHALKHHDLLKPYSVRIYLHCLFTKLAKTLITAHPSYYSHSHPDPIFPNIPEHVALLNEYMLWVSSKLDSSGEAKQNTFTSVGHLVHNGSLWTYTSSLADINSRRLQWRSGPGKGIESWGVRLLLRSSLFCLP